MKEWTVAAVDEGARIDRWLADRPEIGSRGRSTSAIECGKVFLNGEELVWSGAGRKLRAGDRVGYWPDRPGSRTSRSREIVSARDALHIVHQDRAILVLDKPAGWLVEPLPGEERGEVTLRDLLADHLRNTPGSRPFVVHRIDRDTSGLVLFALAPDARDALKAQFERRTPERVYLAIVSGTVVPLTGTWRDKLVWDRERLLQVRAHADEERAKDAVAHYRVLEQHAGGAVLEVSLVTGKRNQIRVQAGLRGYPLVGERIYLGGGRSRRSGEAAKADGRREAEGGGLSRRRGKAATADLSRRSREAAKADGRREAEGPSTRPERSRGARSGSLGEGRGTGRGAESLQFPRQALHAARLAFEHPATGRRVEFEAPVPEDLRGLVERLRRGRD